MVNEHFQANEYLVLILVIVLSSCDVVKVRQIDKRLHFHVATATSPGTALKVIVSTVD